MDHFPIVQALCRAALAEPNPAVRKQVERLRDALTRAGEEKQASSLRSMLSAAERTQDMAPSRIKQSRAFFGGEALTTNTPLPVDRETASPLADIIFPNDVQGTPPLFDNTVTSALSSVLEEWSNLEALSAVGVDAARTCLIYGAPGTGKTRLALWIAAQLDLPIVVARLDGLISSFLGTTARNIGNLFTFANRYRCLLLLDEFDALAKLRDDPQEVGEIKRVVNALLQNLDGRRETGLTIGITNHQGLLDPAVWRRFEIQLEIPKPDFDVRLRIVRNFMPPLNPPEPHVRLISWFTEGASGAEVEALVRTYKKASAVPGPGRRDLLETLRQFATLNSGRVEASRRALIFGDSKVLLQTMRDDPLLQFSMADIGEVAGRDKSTVSRQLGRSRASGDTEA